MVVIFSRAISQEHSNLSGHYGVCVLFMATCKFFLGGGEFPIFQNQNMFQDIWPTLIFGLPILK